MKHFARIKVVVAGAVLLVSTAAPTVAMIASSPSAKVADIVVTKPIDKPSTKLF